MRSKTGKPNILLAVFGKHPGWDDHIEDLGVDSTRLIEARRILYARGIAGAIEAGLWDKLQGEGGPEPFGHIVVWLDVQSPLIGRLWASRDGKGRDRFPMLALAECQGMNLETALAVTLPELAILEEQARALCEAAAMRQALAERREALRLHVARLAGEDAATQDAQTPQSCLARLAAAPQWGANGLGLRRTFYGMRREWCAFAPRAAVTADKGAVQMRVPPCGATPGEAATLWLRALEGQIADGATRLALAPLHGRWLDLVVGVPGPAQLFCLRASAAALPAAADIPYVFDAAAEEELDILYQAACSGNMQNGAILGLKPNLSPFGRLAQRLGFAQ